MDNAARLAGVVELVDAPDSKSGARNGVRVRVPPPAPIESVVTAFSMNNLKNQNTTL